ncbi:hypothetical protein B0J15DRAFT_23213 [Fusarium solani]|uniref:Uncharacterized protein n=1 Tax=Fusarium solani TaxID=169388 RepID=A0A9P9L894_FUSSL|nr:uncharacterized protein B0J15DRAFT_23213 [Fusarium solani]KAH7275733.1 hypothetical protein B0J15DRAFT_23213 [Fusarium solani]
MISQSPWKALDGPSTYSPDWDPRLTDPASDWLINDRGACSLATLARHKAPAIGPPVSLFPGSWQKTSAVRNSQVRRHLLTGASVGVFSLLHLLQPHRPRWHFSRDSPSGVSRPERSTSLGGLCAAGRYLPCSAARNSEQPSSAPIDAIWPRAATRGSGRSRLAFSLRVSNRIGKPRNAEIDTYLHSCTLSTSQHLNAPHRRNTCPSTIAPIQPIDTSLFVVNDKLLDYI